MYIRVIFFSLSVFLLTCGALFAEDLYLLDIKGQTGLKRVESVVDFSHGIIDGKFIVLLNQKQIKTFKTENIGLTLLANNCRLEDYYLLKKEHDRPSRAVLSLSPLYATSNSYIVQLEKSSVDILGRDGYMVFELTEKKTPFFYNQPLYPMPSRIDYPFDSLAPLVNADSLFSYVSRMEAFYTRFTPTDSCVKARNWIGAKFAEFGYSDISYQYFLASREMMDVYNEPAWNVICVKEGTERPDEWIIIGGHYDSYTSNDYNYPAPGADDNASGVAATLELARIYKDMDFKRSLMFVAWGGEEQWLDGSDFQAEEMYLDSVDIELAVNFDVIAYEADTIPEYYVCGYPQWTYGLVFVDAAARLTDLIPFRNDGGVSDEWSFSDRGYNTASFCEYTYHPLMHTIYDNTSNMDFDYMRKIIQTAVVGIPVIDAAPDPIVSKVYDVGDGQSLRIIWDSSSTNFSYKVIYGLSNFNPYDTVVVPAQTYSIDLSGLNEGATYYFAVLGESDNENCPIGFLVSSGSPNLIPQMPEEFKLDIDTMGLKLSWLPSATPALDFSHYKILRKEQTGSWVVLEPGWIEENYVDLTVLPHTKYYYKILAVDSDTHESDSTETVSGTLATFDGGVLLVDETQQCGDIPLEQNQIQFFSDIFGETDFTIVYIDSADQAIERAKLGQHNPVFWIDDDNCLKHLERSLDSLKWYFEYKTDFFLAGWRSLYSFTGTSYFYEGNILHDQFGISYINENPNPDFIGAVGQEGWPDLVVRADAPNFGRLNNTAIFEVMPDAEVIYRYDSYSSHPYFNDKPVGVALDTYHGKRVVLSFPLYFLTVESAQALIAKTLEYFAEESVLYGDVNGDWAVNIFDITYIISYLYMGGPPPQILSNADVNGDCTINIFDATYLITYLYKNGPAPFEGCE